MCLGVALFCLVSLLFVVCCPLFGLVVRCSLFFVCCLSFVVRCVSFVDVRFCCSLFVVCYSLLFDCGCLVFVVCSLFFRLWFVVS